VGMARLDGEAKNMPIYKKDNEDFPIRGLVICSDCGYALTASWNKGRNKKYPKYRCTRCPNKNYPRGDMNKSEGFVEGIHTKFIRLLTTYDYKPHLREAMAVAIRANLEHRYETNKKRLTEIERGLLKLEATDKQIAEKNFKCVLSDTLAKKLLDENDKERTQLTLERNGLESNPDEVMTVVERSLSILEDISSVWLRVELDIKKRFQNFLFPEGLYYNGSEFGTNKLALCIEPKWTMAPQKLHDVIPMISYTD